MRKKGFTLIELLVVITIIAMLLAILMPALSKVKALAARLICATNCKGLGTAMFVYGHDYDGSFPVQGGRGDHPWGAITGGWQLFDKNWADPSSTSPITVGASLYLLIREVDVPTGSFICKSGGQREYDGWNDNGLEFEELFDFGLYDVTNSPKSGPKNHVSYAYHLPYQVVSGFPAFPPSGELYGSFAILADKNPLMDPRIPNVGTGYDSQTYIDYADLLNGGVIPSGAAGDTYEDISPKYLLYVANAEAHGREGQNVLFADGSARFERRPDVGVNNDNIYTNFTGPGPWVESDKRTGGLKTEIATGLAKSDNDSYLVNDDDRTL